MSGVQRRSRHTPPSSPEERIQHRLRTAESQAEEAWRRGPYIVYGVVDTTDASVVRGTAGWSASKNGTGNVIITFSPGFASTPVVICAAADSTPTSPSVAMWHPSSNLDSTHIELYRFTAAGAAADGHIAFVAYGQRAA